MAPQVSYNQSAIEGPVRRYAGRKTRPTPIYEFCSSICRKVCTHQSASWPSADAAEPHVNYFTLSLRSYVYAPGRRREIERR
jgi:hypothetical protein